jgi:transcriptional regulator with XRE-family HTH domain
MADRPSEQLLVWLRELIQRKGLNTAAVAEKAGLPRARVRKLLGGAEPMLVDELMQLSGALDITPGDMGLAQLDDAPEGDVAPSSLAEAEADPVKVDPFGNHPEQMFRVAFGLGVDFFFLTDVAQLADSGVPQPVLAQYEGGELPIKLDAAYHSYNDPRYSEHGITLTLSFDQLYECTFPWSAVKQFILFPAEPVQPAAPEPEPEPEGTGGGVPHLRLVT